MKPVIVFAYFHFHLDLDFWNPSLPPLLLSLSYITCHFHSERICLIDSLFVSLFVFPPAAPGIKPRASQVQGKCFTAELHLASILIYFSNHKFYYPSMVDKKILSEFPCFDLYGLKGKWLFVGGREKDVLGENSIAISFWTELVYGHLRRQQLVSCQLSPTLSSQE